MRRLDLTNYTVMVPGPEGPVPEPFQVRESIVNVLFAQERLDAAELLRRDRLGERILGQPGDSLLIEEADFQKIKASFEGFKGFRRIDVELVKRVLEAPEVQVEEVPTG